jgi:hypothetical protein
VSVDQATYPRVGFTGTRYALPEAQRDEVREVLYLLRRFYGATELHHGDCVGADAFAARSAREFGYKIVCHPPTNSMLRAHAPADVVLTPMPYLLRNRQIVEVADLMIGMPHDDHEVQRSGTWATIRHARKIGRPLLVIGPAGEAIEARGITAPLCPF